MTVDEQTREQEEAAGGPWRPWRVARQSGFEVRDADGYVGLVQIDRKRFLVEKPFRFSERAVIGELVDKLVAKGRTREQAELAVDDARLFTPSTENPTDLASVPQFMRWFETAYGAHTLAAIIHDDLIREKPNDGPLEDDTLSDRFFRLMMQSAGVPWLKRWIMWAAVALRSRWAVGGIRRASVVVWLVLAVTGITAAVWAAGCVLFDWGRPVEWSVLAAVAVVLPLAAAALWGKQYGAGIVAAVAGLWIVPAAALAGLGYVIYLVLEGIAKRVGLR